MLEDESAISIRFASQQLVRMSLLFLSLVLVAAWTRTTN